MAMWSFGRRKQKSAESAENSPLALLHQLASDFAWCWHQPSIELFDTIAAKLGHHFSGNPVALLRSLSPTDRELICADKSLTASIGKTASLLREQLGRDSWWDTQDGGVRDLRIAFFSAEFGVHWSLPVYSGGLGVLAGDIIKSASDLGVPLVGVTLFYHEGYFQQQLSLEGWQSETYPTLVPSALAIELVKDASGQPITTSVQLADETVSIQIWRAKIGRTSLFLLDTNIRQNSESARGVTARLYGGDTENRIRQEVVLGIGGLRALRAMGIEPDVYHMNEGHSAFLSVEQLAHLVRKHSITIEQALAIVKDSHIFTTHTPVPAGNDNFNRDLVSKYLAPYVNELGTDIENLLRLGRVDPNNSEEHFSMSVLGLRTSGSANAVSELHGHVSRELWRNIWPGAPIDEIPISHVTNGVHIGTWLAPEMATLFSEYLDARWQDQDYQRQLWEGIDKIPDHSLWQVRNSLRERLVAVVRNRLMSQRQRQGAEDALISEALAVLSPNALTIGFARRFATYKRATLLLRDLGRLLALARNNDRPIQFIFAGKAHPADQPGKEFLAQIARAAQLPELRGKLIVLENYDMELAQHLVHGVDVWLNTPRRPLEASGTSGMKAALNGALNVSILDGWWCEAYNGMNGFSIGDDRRTPGGAEIETHDNHHTVDETESQQLLSLLEQQIVPMFYARDLSDSGLELPAEWIKRMKNSIKTISPQFSAKRMVIDYARRFYIPHGLTRSHR